MSTIGFPLGGSPALSGANFANSNLAGLEVVNYRGAFGSDNWTSGWTQFNPKNYQIIGITQLSSLIPERFSLEQNYPNPFNPATKIRYNLRSSGHVTLSLGTSVSAFLLIKIVFA